MIRQRFPGVSLGWLRPRHQGAIRPIGAGFILAVVAGCGVTVSPISPTPSEIALGGTATASYAAITAAGYTCPEPGRGATFTIELCQRPQPTENLVPPDSMIRIYSRPDGSVAGLDVYVLGSHASLAGALTVALGIALAPTVSPADASSIEAFVTGHLPTTVPGHASAAVSPRLALAISDDGGVLEANLWAPDVVAWVNAVTSGTATHPPLPPTPAGP